MKYLIILLIVFSSYSCGDESNIDEAVNAVLNNYGGICKYEIGKTIKLNKKINFYALTIRDSEYLKQFDDLSIPASNIALIFYSNLSNFKDIDEIHVNISSDKKSNSKKIFSSNDIEKFKKKENIFKKINQFIVKKQYDKLYNSFDNTIKKQLKKSDIIDVFENQNKEFGEISDVFIQGFEFNNTIINDKELTLVNFIGTVKRASNNTRISIFIDNKTDKIYSIEFDW